MRTFVAIEIEPEIEEAILAAGARLRSTGLKATWVKEGAVHLTLKFLGEVKVEKVPEIGAALTEAASGIEPFAIRVAHLGAFPNARRPRVVWAGVEEPSGALRSLWETMEKSLSRLGFKREGRGFHPHITIGRVRGAPRDISSALSDPFEGGEQDVGGIVLFQSELRPSGAVHTPLARIPLGPSTPPPPFL